MNAKIGIHENTGLGYIALQKGNKAMKQMKISNSIYGCRFTPRTENALVRGDILTTKQLKKAKMTDLRKLKGFGRLCEEEVRNYLINLK